MREGVERRERERESGEYRVERVGVWERCKEEGHFKEREMKRGIERERER